MCQVWTSNKHFVGAQDQLKSLGDETNDLSAKMLFLIHKNEHKSKGIDLCSLLIPEMNSTPKFTPRPPATCSKSKAAHRSQNVWLVKKNSFKHIFFLIFLTFSKNSPEVIVRDISNPSQVVAGWVLVRVWLMWQLTNKCLLLGNISTKLTTQKRWKK